MLERCGDREMDFVAVGERGAEAGELCMLSKHVEHLSLLFY